MTITDFAKRLRLICVLILVGILAACSNNNDASLPLVTEEGDDQVATLTQQEVSLPARSLMIPKVEAQASCGAIQGNRKIDGDSQDWRGEPGWIAGMARRHQGELIWTDYPFDDDGTGQFLYPGEGEELTERADSTLLASPRQQRYGSNAADIVEFRIAADADNIYMLVQLNFLNALDTTVVGIALDTAPGGEESWPRNAGVSTPGADLFITLAQGCGWVQSADGEHRLDALGAASAVDTAHNVIELAFPRDLLGDQWSIAAGAGLWDASNAQWQRAEFRRLPALKNESDVPIGASSDDDPALFNLLFRHDEALAYRWPNSLSLELLGDLVRNLGSLATNSRIFPRTFQSINQHQQLKTGSTGDYRLEVDLNTLAQDDAAPLQRGDETHFTRVFRSNVDAEGVFRLGAIQAMHLSRYQPYAISVPPCLSQGDCQVPGEGPPLIIFLHGGTNSHASLPRDLFEGLQQRQADAIIATPLSFGLREPWYRGFGELGVLHTVADVEKHYPSDKRRRILSGFSMGGFGTLRLAGQYPDLWSAAFAHCSVLFENNVSDEFLGNFFPSLTHYRVHDTLDNLINLPLRHVVGLLDPLAPFPPNLGLRNVALQGGLDYQQTVYVEGHHCSRVTGAPGFWFDEHVAEYQALMALERETPARIHYVADPRQYEADDETIGVYDLRDLGIEYRGAYWLSDVALSDPGERGDHALSRRGIIKLVNHSQPGWAIGVEDCADGLIANPTLEAPGLPLHTYICQSQTRAGETEAVLEISSQNISAATVDGRVLSFGPDYALHVSSDAPLSLRIESLTATSASGECLLGWHNEKGASVFDLAADNDCQIQVRR